MTGGTSYGWMMGRAGYTWMTGGTSAPGWMIGNSLPGFMMGANTDPGQVMGRLFADAPGPRVSSEQATALGSQVPAGASVDRAANRVTFTATSVSFTVVASPAGGPDETFRIAGLVNPTVVVHHGAHVSIQLVNADPDSAHGLVITASTAGSSWMPMMNASPAFAGAALWFLGNSHLGRHAHRHPQLHRRRVGHLPVPLPRPRARPKGHGGHSCAELSLAGHPMFAHLYGRLARMGNEPGWGRRTS